MPRPSESYAAFSPEHVADEIALCAVAMYLHHELAARGESPSGCLVENGK